MHIEISTIKSSSPWVLVGSMMPVVQMTSVCCAFFMLFLLIPSGESDDFVKHGIRTGGNNIDVGVILDLGTSFGIVTNFSVAMAAQDLRAATTFLRVHIRHSAIGDSIGSANAVNDLIHNVGVEAIVSSHELTSEQTTLVGYMSSHVHVPFISLSTSGSPALMSFTADPFMLGIDSRDIDQARAITAIVKAYKWEEVILLHHSTNKGINLISLLTRHLRHEANLKTIQQRAITPTTDVINDTLKEAAMMNTKVFIAHTSFSLVVEIFKQASIIGLMSEGYAWIVTSEITNLLNHMDHATIDSMQGVLGLRNKIPKSAQLSDFEIRWGRQMKREQWESDVSELDIYSLMAYDIMFFIAKSTQTSNLNEHSLINSMLSTQIKGLADELRVVDGRIPMSDVFEIVNIAGRSERLIGYWTPELGLRRNVNTVTKRSYKYSTDAQDLSGVVWPGGVVLSPSRRRIAETKLVVGYPMTKGFYEYVKEESPGRPVGFSIDVFQYVMKKLAVEFDWRRFPRDGIKDNYYDRLVEQAANKVYDAIAGDVTITANRAEIVDFSQPYADSDVAMIVLAEDENDTNNPAWFLKPMSLPLWGATFGIILLKGCLVWFFEYNSNNLEFRGTYSKKLGKFLALSFSSFVFADNDKLKSNYARIIVILWTVLSFVLITGYTANLTSMLTVERLLPKVKDLQGLIHANDWIGFQSGSFVEAYLIRRGAKNHRAYSTVAEYVQALTNGSVVAIVDEMPYIRVFLSLHSNFAVVDRINHTGGLAFVFPKNSSLSARVSQALLKLRESEDMCLIERKWFENDTCSTAKQDTDVSNNQLTFGSFKWLFIIVLSVAAFIFIIFLVAKRRTIFAVDNMVLADPLQAPHEGNEVGSQVIQLGRMDNSFYETASSDSDSMEEEPLNPAAN